MKLGGMGQHRRTGKLLSSTRMSVCKLSFDKIRRRDPLSFAKAVTAANIFQSDGGDPQKIRSDLSGLNVDFARTVFLEAVDVAMLAVVIRRVAEEGKPVTISWPRSAQDKP